MVPAPMAIGLTLCNNVLVEAVSHNVSLVSSFASFRGNEFPFVPAPFYVFAPMIGGQGEGMIELTVTQLETNEEVYQMKRRTVFSDRFKEVHALFQISNCVFPETGAYLFTLLVDGEWMAQRRILVKQMEITE